MALINNPGGRTPVTTGILDSVNRGAVAGTIGAPVDIVNTILGVTFPGLSSPKPVMGSEWIGDKLQKAGMVSNTRQPLGEFVAGFLPVGGLTGSVGKVADAAKNVGKFSDIRKAAVFPTGRPEYIPEGSFAELSKGIAENIGIKGADNNSIGTMLAYGVGGDKHMQNVFKSKFEGVMRSKALDYKNEITKPENMAKVEALDKEYGSKLTIAHKDFNDAVLNRLELETSMHGPSNASGKNYNGAHWYDPEYDGGKGSHFIDLLAGAKSKINETLPHELQHAKLYPDYIDYMSENLADDLKDIIAPVHYFADDENLMGLHGYLTGVGHQPSDYNDTTEIISNLMTGPRYMAAELGLIDNPSADFTMDTISQLADHDPRYAQMLELVADPEHYLKMLNKMTPVALMAGSGIEASKTKKPE